MSVFRVVGFDTSLTSFGMVAAHIELEDGRPTLRYVAGDVIETEKDGSAKKVGDDLLRRFGELARRSWAFTREHDPHVITVEQAITPVGKRKGLGGFGGESPQVAQNLGRARGLVDALAAGIEHVTLFERSGQAIKKAATGDHLADKTKVIAFLEKHFPEIRGCYRSRLVKGVAVPYLPLREHTADAAGSILAVLSDEQFLQMVAHQLSIDVEDAGMADFKERERLAGSVESAAASLDEHHPEAALSPAKEG